MMTLLRMRCATAKLVGAVLTILWTVSASAQSLPDYDVTAWTTEDGLPSGSIWALAQDAEGYLWIGSESGLARFDGIRFVMWRDLGDASFPEASVLSLLSAKDGTLWVGFGGSTGVGRISRGEDRIYGTGDGLTVGDVTALAQDAEGIIWAASSGALFHLLDDRWVREPDMPSPVRSIQVMGSGRVFVLLDQGVMVRQPGSRNFARYPTQEPYVRAVHEDGSGRIWLADRVLRRTHAPDTPVTPVTMRNAVGAPLSGLGMALASEADQSLWIGTVAQGLLFIRNPSAPVLVVDQVTTLNGLSNDATRCLIRDRDGNVWFGTANGLNRLRPHKFRTITEFGSISYLASAGDATLWAITQLGLVQFDVSGAVTGKVVVPRTATRAFHVDRHGGAWLANDDGVRMYSSTVQQKPLTTFIPSFHRVRAITTDLAGATWLYDLTQGLVRWQNGHAQLVDLPPGYRGALTCGIHADRAGRVWVGFYDGSVAAVQAGQAPRKFGRSDGLDVGPCNTLREGDNGRIWVLGVHGLAWLNGNRFVTIARIGNQPLESLVGLRELAGHTWLYTAGGVTRIRGTGLAELTDGRADHLDVQFYGSESGIAGRSSIVPSLAIAADRLWFATARGLAFVDPGTLADGEALAPVRIDSVLVDDRRESGMPTELPSSTQRVDVEFSAPSLSSGRNLRFRYRLDGFETAWRNAGPSQRRVTYTNLPPRSFVLQLEQILPDGASASAATWTFLVRPAFYQTQWFALVSVATAGLTGWLAWRLRVRKIRREFALLLKERVRLSREIHDTLLQGLIGVSLQLGEVEHDTDTSLASRERLGRARRHAENYIRDARESIWNLRSSALRQAGLPAALRAACERALVDASGDIEFRFASHGTPTPMSPDVEEQLLRIGREAFTNAVRHARATTVCVELQYEPGQVAVTVRDNGDGFDESQPNAGGHLGLTSMRERAATIGADLRIVSARGSGTTVHVAAPNDAGHHV